MLALDAALVWICGSFTGTYAPFQSIHLKPLSNGVLVAASDHGRISAIGFDRHGRGDESWTIIPSPELLRSCAPLKSAKRELRLDEQGSAVITFRKTTADEVKRFPTTPATTPFPPIADALAACIATWGATPKLSATAGRYDSNYLEKSIKILAAADQSLVLSAFDGGPLRLQSESLDVVVMLMPQCAEPIPPIPDWIQELAGSAACHSGHAR